MPAADSNLDTSPEVKLKPVVPAWAMAAAAGLAGLLFYYVIGRTWTETDRRSPEYAQTHNSLGIVFSQFGRADEAITQFQLALECQPDHAEACNNLGNVLLQKGRWDEAVAAYRKASLLKADYADAQNNLGLALLQNGRMDEAIGHFQAALDIRPNYADAQNNYGYAMLLRGRLDEAAKHFERSIQLNSGIAQAHHNLALTLFQLGRVAEAVTSYEAALRVNPAQLGSLNNLAWILSTSPEASVRNGARALEVALQANELSGGADAVILHTVAAALAELGRFTEAVQVARKSLEHAEASQNSALAEAVREQLKLYEAGAPFRDMPATATSS